MIHLPEPARVRRRSSRLVRGALIAVAALSALAVAAVALAPPSTADPTTGGGSSAVVVTDRGPIRGVVTGGYRSFQGIPYAAAPVGELRWVSPQPPTPWAGVRDATKPGNACAQPAGIPMGRPSTAEDCLFLNVTTPRGGGARLRPVMVWLHGGSLTYGAGDIYSPASLVTRGDVVVVTVNYRLGALGFLAHPSFDAARPGRATSAWRTSRPPFVGYAATPRLSVATRVT